MSFLKFPKEIQSKIFSYMTDDEKHYFLGKNHLISDYIIFLVIHKIKPKIIYEYVENQIELKNIKRVNEVISVISFSGNLSLLQMIEFKYPNLFENFRESVRLFRQPRSLFRNNNHGFFPSWNNSTIYWICLSACSGGHLHILNWVDKKYNKPTKVYLTPFFNSIEKKRSYSYKFPLFEFYSMPELVQFTFNNKKYKEIIYWLKNRSSLDNDYYKDDNFPFRYKNLLTVNNLDLIRLKIKIYYGFNYKNYINLI